MDNSRIIVVSETEEEFRAAIHLAFKRAPTQLAEAWWLWNPRASLTPMPGIIRNQYEKDRPEELLGVVIGAPCLVFSWHAEEKMYPFPSKISSQLAATFAWEWLSKQNYGQQPDHDGSNHKGFIVFNDAWGHFAGNHYSFVGVGPAWAMYGK